jgi:hypothetical protein
MGMETKNINFKFQLSDHSNISIIDGGFENFTAGVPDDWTKVETGSSTVTQELSNLAPETTGSSAVRITYDGSASAARVVQTRTLLKESFYRLGFWIYCSDPLGVKKFGLRIRDSAATVYLQDNGTWSSTSNDIEVDVFNSWVYFELSFLTHPDYTSYFIGIGNGSELQSNYAIIDDLILSHDSSGFSLETCTINGMQYKNKILSNPINIVDIAAYNGILQNRDLTIEIADPENINTNERIYKGMIENIESRGGTITGINIIAYDYLGNVLQRYRLTNYTYRRNSIVFELSNRYSELADNSVLDVITEEMFPDAPTDSIGQFIPFFVGQFLVDSGDTKKGEKDFVLARRVESVSGSSPSKYIIGYSPNNIVAFSGSQDFQYVIDDNGNEITAASCTLVTPTGTEDAAKYHYIEIDYTEGNFPYVLVHFKYTQTSAQNLIERIGTGLFKTFTFDVSDITGTLDKRNYNPVSENNQSRYDPRILIDKSTKYTDVLKLICETFNFSYVISQDSNILFKYLDLKAPFNSTDTTLINDETAKKFIINRHEKPYTDMENKLDNTWGDGQYHQTFENIESQVNNKTVRTESYNYGLFPGNYSVSRRYAHFTSKGRMTERHFSRDEYTVKIQNIYDIITGTSTISDLLQPMRIFAFKHPVFQDNETHYMQIREITRVYPDNTASVRMVDISKIEEIDSNATLLLQSNSLNLDQLVFDRAADGYHLIQTENAGSVTHDTTRRLFSKSVLTDAKSNPSLRIGPFDFIDGLNPFTALDSTGSFGYYSYTVSFWILIERTSTIEAMLGAYTDAANFWAIYKDTNDKIVVYLETSNIQRLNIKTTTSLLTNKWYHFVFHRNHDGIGVYLNGQQEAYNAGITSYSINESVYAFNDGNASNYFQGSLQDVYFALNGNWITGREKGWFNCNPNSGNTDFFPIPTGLMSRFFGKYWTYKKLGT